MRFILITIFFVLSLVSKGNSMDVAGEEYNRNLYPVPQKIEWGKVVAFPGQIGLVNKSALIDAHTLALFKKFLLKNKIELISEEKLSEGLPKIIFEDGEKEGTSAFRREDYAISVKSAGASLKIEIKAGSDAGFYYAFQTFRQLVQLVDSKLVVSEVAIEDYPLFPLRGIVEGAYGIWDEEGRKSVLRWMGTMKLNTFLYAPKDDPYVRNRWRDKYPEEMIEKFKEYIKICAENKITFVLGISPALSVIYSSDEDFESVVERCQRFYKLGVNNFTLFFDDIPPELSAPEDKETFKNIGEAEVYFTNRIYKKLKEIDDKIELQFCPIQYAGTKDSIYISEVREKLEPDIKIGWTGMFIISREISVEDARRFKEVTGRKPSIGDNWPTLAPLSRRDKKLYKYSDAFTVNPFTLIGGMEGRNEPELSKIPVATVADYAWNPEKYDPERSFKTAVELLGGKEVYPEFLWLVEEVAKSEIDYETHFKQQVAKLEKQIKNHENISETLGDLSEEFKKVVNIRESFGKGIESDELFGELEFYLPKFEEFGEKCLELVNEIEKALGEGVPIDAEFAELKNLVSAKTYPAVEDKKMGSWGGTTDVE